VLNGTQVIIAAAGLGTGLRPLSIERPKSLAPVCNRTLVNRLLNELQRAGIDEAVIAIGPSAHQAYQLFKAEAPADFNLRVEIMPKVFEGTVPLARHVWDSSASSAMVIYGDSLLSVDFRSLLNFHANARQQGGAATILFHRPDDLRVPRADGRTYHGVLSVDDEGRVTRFVEKPLVEEIAPPFDLANAAAFICERSLMEHPSMQEAKDFSFDVFEKIAAENRFPLYGCDIKDGFRRDIGSLRRFFDINMQVLRRELPAPIAGREVSRGVWIGEDTDCDSSRLIAPVCLGNRVVIKEGARIGPNAIIGDGCRIGERASVSESVLLEGCEVGAQAQIENIILGPHCRVGDGIELPAHCVMGAYSIIGDDDLTGV